MEQMKLWFPEIDVLKAAAILLVVFCHIDNYVSCYDLIRLIDGYAALIGLSIFFFTSGFLLSQINPVINSIKDIKKFYTKKFLRIFPLYWVALVGLAIIFGPWQINPGNVEPYNLSLNNLFLHFLGLQGIFPYGNIQSMWFVGVIVLFYLLYPLIAYISRSSFETLTVSSIIFILLAILHFFAGLIDINALIYYPLFISGIFINQTLYSSQKIVDKTLLKRILILNLALIFVIFLILVTQIVYNINLQIFPAILLKCAMIPLCIFGLIFTRIYLQVRGDKMSIISSIAFGTYAIYLFQHQFLAVFTLITDLIIQNIILQDLIILTFGIAGAILCGIIIQNVEQFVFLYKVTHQH